MEDNVRMNATPTRRFRKLRLLLITFAVLLLSLVFLRPVIISQVAGAWSRLPSDALSPAAQAMVDAAFEGIDSTRLVDFHTHVAGIGTDDSGCEVHPGMRSMWSPVRKFQFDVYLHASGVRDLERADREYAERLAELIRAVPQHGRNFILAFDRHYNEAGEVVPEETEFHVPNEYVMQLAEEFPDCFLPAISVHPYRKDALEELDRYGARGARLVKWLPNAMGIDPASELCAPYYERMREWNMILLTHTGEEKAVHAEEAQALGNPLALRVPLDAGVTVFAAHCGSMGTNEDGAGEERHNFALFMELFDEPRYEGLLFGEISTLTQSNRLGEPLRVLLERPELWSRLVNGSDYPLPAINFLYQTRQLESRGWIDSEQRGLLNEIYDVNPLLFDFVLKRVLRHPETKASLPPSIFMLPEGMEVVWPIEAPLERASPTKK